MTPITETLIFPAAVNMYETLDPVLGGVAGESNDPIIALANRTRYLYDFHAGFTDVAVVTSNTTINTTFLRKLIYINATGNLVLILDALSSFTTGQSLHFKCKNALGKNVAIVPTGSDTITDGSLSRLIWLYDTEEISLTKISSTAWEITFAKGNFDIAGNDGMLRKLQRNTVIANGTLASRADYARVWSAVFSDAIADSLWLSHDYNYRTNFSIGDGATTFRWPDARSMFWRGLDLGRGASFTRISSVTGAFEPDAIKGHSHGFPIGDGVQAGSGGYIPDMTPPDGNIRRVTGVTDSTGGAENVVKNMGLIPVIYF